MFIGFEAQSQDFDLHSRLKSVDFQIELGAFATEPLADLNIQLVFTGPLNSAGLLAFHFGVGGDLWSDLSSSDAGFVFTTALSYGGRHRVEVGADFRRYVVNGDYWTITPAKIAYRGYIGKRGMFRLFFAPYSSNVGDYSGGSILLGLSWSVNINLKI